MTSEVEGAAEAVTEDVAAVDQTADQADAQAQEGDPGDDAAAATTEEAQKPRRSAQERINEAVKAQREAEREREYWREQALRTQQAPQPRQEAAPAEESEPDPAAYEYGETDVRFIRDHATFHARKAFREEQARTTAETRVQTAMQTFEQRIGEQFPEGEPEGLTRLRSLPTLSPVIQETILDSDVGPKLADHLGKNIRELNRISALPPITQARELAKLEMKLATPPAPTPKTATDAPAPTPQVRGAGGQFKPAPDTDDFAAFERTYG